MSAHGRLVDELRERGVRGQHVTGLLSLRQGVGVEEQRAVDRRRRRCVAEAMGEVAIALLIVG